MDTKANAAAHAQEHPQTGAAKALPVPSPTPVISVSPITLPSPNRSIDLQLRVSAPTTGTNLPILLLSHGGGHSKFLASCDGYGPLTNFYAAHGFAVLQPTHLSSATIALDPVPAEAPLYWHSRALDMSHILDNLPAIEVAVPTLKGRLDPSRVAVLGHSMGGHTAGVLLGQRVLDNGTLANLRDPRIKAGVLIGAPGAGGDSLAPGLAARYAALDGPDFTEMTAPALIVAGSDDTSEPLTVRGAEWHMDSYRLSNGPKALLTMFGARHGFGGVAGFDAAETDDESVERLVTTQRMTLAYLRSQLYEGDGAWREACEALERIGTLGKVESKNS